MLGVQTATAVARAASTPSGLSGGIRGSWRGDVAPLLRNAPAQANRACLLRSGVWILHRLALPLFGALTYEPGASSQGSSPVPPPPRAFRHHPLAGQDEDNGWWRARLRVMLLKQKPLLEGLLPATATAPTVLDQGGGGKKTRNRTALRLRAIVCAQSLSPHTAFPPLTQFQPHYGRSLWREEERSSPSWLLMHFLGEEPRMGEERPAPSFFLFLLAPVTSSLDERGVNETTYCSSYPLPPFPCSQRRELRKGESHCSPWVIRGRKRFNAGVIQREGTPLSTRRAKQSGATCPA